MDGTLLTCPHCALSTKPQILGRLLTNGDLLVLRFHSGTTIIHAKQYNLQCSCGFMFMISGTVISGTIQQGIV